MVRIMDNLYVGTVFDIPFSEQFGYSVLGACKEPLHRQYAKLQGASEEGYVGKAMPRDEKEYLFAERDHALYLNLIDAREAKYIPDEVIDKALEFIDKEIADGRNVLICCNKGESRSPSVALMWLIKKGFFRKNHSALDVMGCFKLLHYNNYRPSEGIQQYINKFWEEYCNGKTS